MRSTNIGLATQAAISSTEFKVASLARNDELHRRGEAVLALFQSVLRQIRGGCVEEVGQETELFRHIEAISTWGIGIYDHNHITGELYGSPRMRELYGLSPDVRLTMEVFAKAIFPPDMPVALAAAKEAHRPESGGLFDALHRIQRPDGTLRWIHTRSRTEFGTIDGELRAIRTIGSIMDMTDRHVLKLALERQQERLTQAMTASQVGVFDWDHAPACAEDQLYWSPTLRDFCGYNASELARLEWYIERIHRDDVVRFRNALDASWDPQVRRPFELEIRWHHPDGRLRWHFARASTTFHGSGTYAAPLRTVGAVVDLSQQKHLEQQYHHAQKMEAIGQVAGGVAHDFNNILSVIVGLSDLLLIDLPATSPCRESVEQIHLAGERAAALTQQLLAFSRKQVNVPRVVDLNELLEGAGSLLRRLINESINMTFSPSAKSVRVRIDPNQLEQVLLNLVVNARDAMPLGGQLTIGIDQAQIHESALPRRQSLSPGGYAVLTVADSGTGIPGEIREKIFEPFFTTKEFGKGTGLGLSTVLGIVQQSGGTVECESHLDKGTTFKIYLPSTEEAAETATLVRTLRPQGVTGTLLVVEDDTQLRGVIAEVLARAGYRVLAPEGPVEALALAREFLDPIDLLLTDIVMPCMSGRALAAEISTIRKGITVLFMSGYTEDVATREHIEERTIHFLSKPIRAQSLLIKVEQLLTAASELRAP